MQPVGSDGAPLQVDVRFVCATNRDLSAMMGAGTFRDDLYYRLSVMTMTLPPLRTYKADNLPVIAYVFLKQAAEKHRRDVRHISSLAMMALLAHDYPGNVRELKNTMEHAVIMARSDTVDVADLPRPVARTVEAEPAAEAPAPAAPRPTLAELRKRWLAPLERRYLGDLLAECEGNVREAAALAGVNPVTMYRLLESHGMGRSRRKRAAPVRPEK